MRAPLLGPDVESLYGATQRVRDVPKWGGDAMRALPLGPSVELPTGPRSVRGASGDDGQERIQN
eukprot:8647909-Pyramimonas_sp.AAC.1